MSLKVNNKLRRSHRIHCPFKRKLELGDAQDYLLAAQKDHAHYKRPEDLELYICLECHYLHIGHRPKTGG
jgi:hypothetical protein